MNIKNIVITGEEQLSNRIASLFARTGISATCSSNNIPNADMIIESISGDFNKKKDMVSFIQNQAKNGVILATNSNFNVTEIGSNLLDQSRFIGLHFTFNPFQNKCLVQVVKTIQTAPTTIEICRKLLEQTGLVVVVVEDSPGLVVDRVMAVMVNEATSMYSTKLATIEDIDRITRLCLNWPVGPFEFADTIGLDCILNTLELLSRQAGLQFSPCRLLRQMVALGQLGKKSGTGFYDYRREDK